jgi:hypothetical protein
MTENENDKPTAISEIQVRMDARLAELRPLVEEYQRLEKSRTVLNGDARPARRRRRTATPARETA